MLRILENFLFYIRYVQIILFDNYTYDKSTFYSSFAIPSSSNNPFCILKIVNSLTKVIYLSNNVSNNYLEHIALIF